MCRPVGSRERHRTADRSGRLAMSSTISCGFCATTLAAAMASGAILPHPATPVQAALRRAEGRSSGAREAWLPAGALRGARPGCWRENAVYPPIRQALPPWL